MLPQYSHDLMTSVTLWMANRLENGGQAYINTTGVLYPIVNSGVQGNIYTSPYKGWVYDSCVAGATIPSGFYTSSGNFLTRASGLVFDWNNGRVISPQKWGNLSGVYARKEVNVYYSTVQEGDYVLEKAYGANHNLQYPLTGFNGRELMAPLVMLTNSQGNNAPFALGGIDNTKSTIRALVITNSNYLQDGIGSLIRDAAHSVIPIGSYAAAPLTSSGDLKGATFNYCTGFYNFWGCRSGAYVENVYEIRINERANGNATFFCSALEVDLSKVR